MSTTEAPPARKKPPKEQTSVLFDAPGPRAQRRTRIFTLLALLFLAGIAWIVIVKFAGRSPFTLSKEDHPNQWEWKLWKPFFEAGPWQDFILPGLRNTLTSLAIGTVGALLFGVVFGIGRLSDHWWIRMPSGAVVEFFRAIPLLILIFFIFLMPGTFELATNREFPDVTALTAVVTGLILYNGSVLAEVFRAGILSIPKGQSEAGYALGLRKNGVMRLILVPQATTAMMPAIISQIVVLNKDSALGYLISFEELLNEGKQLSNIYQNLIPAAIVVALIYIAMNMALSRLATWFEARSRRSRKSTAKTLDASNIPGAGMPGGIA